MLMKLSSNIPRYFFIYARLSVICKSYLLFHSVTKFALMSSYLSDASINDDKVVSKENDINQLTEPISRPDNGLLIYWHPDCYLHEIPDHPEQPDRVKHILNKLRQNNGDEHFREAPLITDEQVMLFHSDAQYTKFNKIADFVENAHSQKKYAFKRIDDDTVVMWKTRQAALRAAGSVIQAIDDIFMDSSFTSNRIKTAFCCVRPPGHHAERSRSMGFCFLSNVAIGAYYAKTKYGLSKIAIIDFDVHHGNGSEEGCKEDETLFFGSTHEKDNYPGTGNDPTPFIGDNVRNTIHRRIVNRYLSSGPKSRDEFKLKWRQIIDEMILFKPNLILLSAGFDAHKNDPLSGTELLEEDFEWATSIVIEASRIINIDNPPPIVSSLEGGYDLHALAASASIHVTTLANSNNATFIERASASIRSDFAGDEVAALADHIKSLGIS